MRKILILMYLLTVFLLSACSLEDLIGGKLDMSNDSKKAETRLLQVIEAINNQDKAALEALFSKNAVSESDDFGESVSRLFDYLEGDIVSWESTGSMHGSESISNGNKIKLVSSYYYISTTEQQYYFLLDDYYRDDESPDNVGFHLILVVLAEGHEIIYDKSQKILFDGDQKLSHVGIYLPLA